MICLNRVFGIYFLLRFLICLHKETMYWSTPACSGEIPPPRRAHTATSVEDKIFVFGGSNGTTYYNDLYILDTS